MKMLTKSTILLFTSILLIHLSACNSNNPQPQETNDPEVRVKPLEITQKTLKKDILRYEIDYPSQISNSKHYLLFYAVAISTPNKGSFQLDSSKILDISILNSDQLIEECSNSLSDNKELDKRNIKLEFDSRNKASNLSSLLIDNNLYLPSANLKLNASNYVKTLSKRNIYQPVKLFTAKENTINTLVKEPEQRVTLEVGCIVYDCNKQNDWDAFFKSKKFVEHVYYGLGTLSKRLVDQERNLSIYNF